MAKTYIIGSSIWQNMADSLGAELVLFPDQPLKSEKEIHDYLVARLTEIPAVVVFDMTEIATSRTTSC